MMFTSNKIGLRISVAAAMMATSILPTVVQADNDDSGRVVIYFTRHAEKLTVIDAVTDESDNVIYSDNCNSDRSRCEEALNSLGEKRAELLADWFERRGIAGDITHVFSSDKQRTRQTVVPLAAIVKDYGTTLNDDDGMVDGIDLGLDGVDQVPFAGDKVNETSSNSDSVVPTIEVLQALEPGSVAVVAGHSGTLYRIFGGDDRDGMVNDINDPDQYAGLGIDANSDDILFPQNDDNKVRDFGDIWKVVIRANGTAVAKWRKNLEFQKLGVKDETADVLD